MVSSESLRPKRVEIEIFIISHIFGSSEMSGAQTFLRQRFTEESDKPSSLPNETLLYVLLFDNQIIFQH